MIQLDGDGNTERSSMTGAEMGLSLEEHRPLLYKTDSSRLGSVERSSLKTGKLLSSTQAIRCPSRKLVRSSVDAGRSMVIRE